VSENKFHFKLGDEQICFKLKDVGVGPAGATGTTGPASTIPGPTGAMGPTGPGGPTADHSTLTNLDYAHAGHTNFQKQLIYSADFKAYEIE
jgi:hypothetical protein